MPITRANIEEITESDLVELREHQVAESLSIDYKRVIDAETEDGKRKLLKHASSFANSAGGHLVIGVAEEDGIPTELVGLSGDLDVDAEKRRLENLFRDCLEPRIVGLKVQPIPLGNGRRVLIIRVPKSWNPPHAVLYKGSRKYFVRNSAGAHEASVEELRAMFTAGAALLDRIREFRRTRLKAIHSTETPIRIGDKGRLVLHLIPFSSFGLNSFLDPRKMQGAHLPQGN